MVHWVPASYTGVGHQRGCWPQPKRDSVTRGGFLRGAQRFLLRGLILTPASGIWNLEFEMRLCRAVSSVARRASTQSSLRRSVCSVLKLERHRGHGGAADTRTNPRGARRSRVWSVLPSVLSVLGKGPESRSRACGIAQGASPGFRRPSSSKQPQRGERIRFRGGNSPWFCRPLRGLTRAGAWFPRAGALG